MIGHLLLGHIFVTSPEAADNNTGLFLPLTQTGRMEVVRQILMRKLADPAARGDHGRTAFDLIRRDLPQEMYDEADKKWGLVR